ncbi:MULTISPECIES: DUF397 domain-containing protein [unclassified Streptomyces]|uniref:DUF397 domain-containing protein n=1 Tax=unclassified Streptomyces TaxID=2593676 RepID=UPI002E2E4D3F|nr:DUF397 domain-containing protein [Streptomyces sp. NBC_00223]
MGNTPDLSGTKWRKSSYSNQEGGNCVEVATHFRDVSGTNWRKSSFSNREGGACVEVAPGFPDLVPVRDSKDPQGPALLFAAHAWAAFIADVKGGRLGG